MRYSIDEMKDAMAAFKRLKKLDELPAAHAGPLLQTVLAARDGAAYLTLASPISQPPWQEESWTA